VVDGEYERCSDTKTQKARRKADALESLALYRQGVQISWVELVDYLEQQLIWEVEEGCRLSFLFGGHCR
jgi:hypothetical protein